MVLNPYDLMGVNPNSTCQCVRKRYYALACLCHPDRGGTVDQMQTLHNAYQYVMHQVALNRTTTFDELEKDFEDFCAAQTVAPPTFADIHADAFNLPRFNELFESQADVVDGAFLEGGYAVVPSDLTPEHTVYNPVETHTVPEFCTEMVVYTEPQPAVMPADFVRDLTYTALSDFSCTFGALRACDYKTALSPPVAMSNDVHEHDVMRAFEGVVANRVGNAAV